MREEKQATPDFHHRGSGVLLTAFSAEKKDQITKLPAAGPLRRIRPEL